VANRRTDRFVGVSSRMGVMQYQDYTLSINDRPDRRFTDAQLVEDWHREHPNALHLTRLDTDGSSWYVKRIRKNYNQGKQNHGRRGPDGSVIGSPEVMSLPYNDKRETYRYSDKWWDECVKGRG